MPIVNSPKAAQLLNLEGFQRYQANIIEAATGKRSDVLQLLSVTYHPDTGFVALLNNSHPRNDSAELFGAPKNVKRPRVNFTYRGLLSVEMTVVSTFMRNHDAVHVVITYNQSDMPTIPLELVIQNRDHDALFKEAAIAVQDVFDRMIPAPRTH